MTSYPAPDEERICAICGSAKDAGSFADGRQLLQAITFEERYERRLLDVGDAFEGGLEAIYCAARHFHVCDEFAQILGVGAIAVTGQKIRGKVRSLPTIQLTPQKLRAQICELSFAELFDLR
jgi:hypothetical protein